MPYRVNQDGTIEADTPEEAVELAALLARKKHGRRPSAGNGSDPVAPPKTRTRRRGTPKTRTAAQNGRRPSAAVQAGVKLGQVWQKHGDDGRVIQIDKLLKDGVVPTVIKNGKRAKSRTICKKIKYSTLRATYKLVKDV